ncbi:FIVAR domain-containing protein [Peptoniphilus sp. MSJ-1]|uniref:FIVAR domain-containing protein n=1 Tax=Peptoniphilus ovalis TaxID=2841503 RepID=A0ABS6FGQ9_9FIRM|nr:FIVAR domain-containing protein [Peptoniphilus ovalis]MBU5669213.1 FIVAR domain-containing protein [Peptoniphilus ovalis]
MSKKLTSITLAGVLLLSATTPVFAAETTKTADKTENKIEKIVDQKAKEMKETAAKGLEKGKEKATEVKEKVEEKATETKDKVKEEATAAKEKAEAKKDEIKEKAEAKKDEVKKEADAKKEEVKEKVEEKKAEAMDVQASNQKVTLNGKEVAIFGYNIKDENYFKLRDLAAVLKDTDAKFAVDYKDNVVTLAKGGDYKVLDTDQKSVAEKAKGALTNDKVLVGEDVLKATAYKINDNNYYRLRDLGKALGFGVDYDEATRTVLLTTGKLEDKKEEKAVQPTVAELKEALKKEVEKAEKFQDSEELKKAEDAVKTNYENALAAAKSIVEDKDATKEQVENSLKALVESTEKLGAKADVKVEEAKEEVKKVKDEKKDEVLKVKDEKKAETK